MDHYYFDHLSPYTKRSKKIMWELIVHPFLSIFEDNPYTFFTSGSISACVAYKSSTHNFIFFALMEDLVVSGKLDRYRVIGKKKGHYILGTGQSIEVESGYPFYQEKGKNGELPWKVFLNTFLTMYLARSDMTFTSRTLSEYVGHVSRAVEKKGHKNWVFKSILEELFNAGKLVRVQSGKKYAYTIHDERHTY